MVGVCKKCYSAFSSFVVAMDLIGIQTLYCIGLLQLHAMSTGIMYYENVLTAGCHMYEF